MVTKHTTMWCDQLPVDMSNKTSKSKSREDAAPKLGSNFAFDSQNNAKGCALFREHQPSINIFSLFYEGARRTPMGHRKTDRKDKAGDKKVAIVALLACLLACLSFFSSLFVPSHSLIPLPPLPPHSSSSSFASHLYL